MVSLIITEKPSAMKNIANALADKKPKREKGTGGNYYYSLKHKSKRILVGCAVGHLYNLTEKNKKGWTYPVFDLEWQESYKINKNSDYTKKYLDTLTKIVKEADTFYNACDYDLEGETIFSLIQEKLIKQKAKRMKFSTMTKEELIQAYENPLSSDKPMAEAGRTRHRVDYIFGINLSRALTLSIKNATKVFKILSSGRVQGPALKILADRELEIQNFKSKPFWELEAHGDVYAKHKKDKFWDEKAVKKIYNKIKNEKSAVVQKVTKKIQNQAPPNPFDLTSLQLEAYRIFKILPKETLAIAQQLYTKAYISYPRTSSNQFPPQLNMRSIIQKLSKQNLYTPLCIQLLSKPKLTPNNGRKVDAAHPAIYTTGIQPKNLNERAKKIYDLIVRRTLATFGDPAKRESCLIDLDIKKEPFLSKGTRTLEPGWHLFYGRYAKFDETLLPNLKQGDLIKIKKINLLNKESQPPKRYTPASIIKELESRSLGTKATRSQILDALYQRDYILDTSIQVTKLGLKTVQTLKKYCPEILDEEMTRQLEIDMEEIREKKETKETVLKKAERDLTKTLKHFKKNELKIGKELAKATIETRKKESEIGPCPKCKKGTLRLTKGRFGLFIACDRYKDGCKTTFSLPSGALVKATGKTCQECGYPELLIIRKGKKPQTVCLNLDCKTKKVSKKILEEKRKCPKCNSQLIIRKSLYGSFFSCPNYPECRYIESLNGNNTQKKIKK